MVLIMLVIVAAVSVGALSERRWGDGARRAGARALEILIFGLIPFVTFFTVSHVKLTAGVGAGIAFAWTELAIVTTLAYVAGSRVFRLPRPSTGALMTSVGIVNTGYLGVPLVATLVGGATAVGQAITYDVTISGPMVLLTGFGIGAAFGTRAGTTGRERLRTFLVRNPPLVAFGLALIAPGWATPAWGRDVAQVLVLLMAPLGFFALGVNLMHEQEEGVRVFPPPVTAPVATAIFLRLVVAPLLMLAMSTLIVRVPEPFLIEAGMACGINGLIVGHLFGLDLRLLAGAIGWSTAIVLTAACVVASLGGL